MMASNDDTPIRSTDETAHTSLETTTTDVRGKGKAVVTATSDAAEKEKLIAEGKSLQAKGDFEGAVAVLGEASRITAELSGFESVEYADAMFLYGSALLAYAMARTSPLGASSVPAQETEAELGGLNEKDASRFVFSGDDADMDAPPSSSSVDQKAENGEMEGDANDDGDDNDEENSDGQEEGGEGEEEDGLEVDMRLAWESLDLARVVYQKMGAAGEEKMADVLLALGDVSLEQGLWDQAIEDFSAATDLKRKNLAPENRELAEAQYKLGLAHEFAKNLTTSLECIHGVIATLQAKLNSLKALTGEKVTDKVKSEIVDVEELVQEMHSKIDDLHLQIEESKKAAAAAEPDDASTSTLGSTSTAPANVNDISGLVKSKKSAGTSSKTSPAKSGAVDATTTSASSASVGGMKRKADGIDAAAGEAQMQRQYLYHRLSKDTFRPTKLTIGPWSADSQHGGPPSALMASLLRAHAGEAFRLARLSVSLYRPVPTAGVHRVTITSLNETRSTKHLSIVYADAQSNKLYARAEAILLIKEDATATPENYAHLVQIEAASRAGDDKHKVIPEFPDGATLRGRVNVLAPEGKLSKFMHVMQAVFAVGRAWFGAADEKLLDANRESPCVWYVRSSAGVGLWVDETTGAGFGESRDLDLLESAIMFGDASSGASGVLTWGEFIYSNIDYTINFLRDPEPLTLNASTKDMDHEWVCFRSRTRINPSGSGVTVSDVFDRSGPFATTTQNLVVRKMESKGSKL
ncbi:hypothetical protein HDU81_006770 [Chytriomyces hyalinus]|nr:hypothetical protein HDU81_006770 [Chytriomyces hyalinus]